MRLVKACLLAAAAASAAACVEEVDPSLRAERATTADARAQTSPAAAAEVAVTVRDCTVQLATTTIPAGTVSFQVRNDGGTPQELVLRGAQGEWESGPVPAGETATLSVSLAAGSYQLGCIGADGNTPPGAAITVH